MFGHNRGDNVKRAPDLAMRQVVALRAQGFPSLAQWRQLPRYLTRKERRIAQIALGGLFLALAGLGARWFFAGHTSVAAIGGTYTEGAIGTPRYINPL